MLIPASRWTRVRIAVCGVVLTSLRPGRARLVNESPYAVEALFAGRKLRFEPWQIQTAAPD